MNKKNLNLRQVVLRLMAPAVVILMIAAMISVISENSVYAEDNVEPETTEGNDFVRGHYDIDLDVYEVSGKKAPAKKSKAVNLSRFDAREQPWYQGIKTKNQGGAGLCWAFSTTSASEISYAKEYYEKTGELFEGSPGHLGYFFYNREPDPLGNTVGDRNWTGVNGLDWAMTGGNMLLTMQHLATWSGVGPEENTPYSEILGNIQGSGSHAHVNIDFKYDGKYAYEDCMILEHSIYEEAIDAQTLKDMIYRYGAVSGCLYVWNGYFANGDSSSEAFYNYDKSNNTNHEVTIIGWDDNYSKDNFNSYNPETGEYLKPKKDGAWIVQNSWGDSVHDKGVFYASYESNSLTGYPAVAYDMQPADTYEDNYQYDGTAYPTFYNCGSGTKAANIYKAKTNIELKAVGITEYNKGKTNYTVKIYTGLTDKIRPDSGTLVSETKCCTDTAGCKTIELSEPAHVKEGESYSIVVDFDSELTRIGIEQNAKHEELGFARFQAETARGQSYLWDPEIEYWLDMRDWYTSSFRIKGFADRVHRVTFEDGQGKTLQECWVHDHEAAKAPEVPERAGYRAVGWDTEFSDVTGDMTVKVVWKKLYQITMEETQNGKVETDMDEAIPGELVTVTATGVKGYGVDSERALICGKETNRDTEPKSSSEDIGSGGVTTIRTVFTFRMPEEDVIVQMPFIAKHEHQADHHPKAEATCSAEGLEEYWSCRICDKLFRDGALTREIKEPIAIGKTQHPSEIEEIVKATPDSDGTSVVRCGACGAKLRTDRIDRPAEFTLEKQRYTFNGSVREPGVVIKDASGKAVDPRNYKVTYSGNRNAGTATAVVTFTGSRYSGNRTLKFTISKAPNTLKAKGKTCRLKFSALKKKAQTIKRTRAVKVKGAKGKVTYRLTGVNRSSFRNYFKIAAGTGKITVKKGLKKGTYKLKVQVKASGRNYKTATKRVTIKVIVK